MKKIRKMGIGALVWVALAGCGAEGGFSGAASSQAAPPSYFFVTGVPESPVIVVPSNPTLAENRYDAESGGEAPADPNALETQPASSLEEGGAHAGLPAQAETSLSDADASEVPQPAASAVLPVRDLGPAVAVAPIPTCSGDTACPEGQVCSLVSGVQQCTVLQVIHHGFDVAKTPSFEINRNEPPAHLITVSCQSDADCAEGEACLVTPGEQKCGERLTIVAPVWRAASL